MNVIGEVEGHICILVDDIIDSGGTIVNAADALLEQGATEVYAYITHGVLSGGAVARITASRLKELVITDSIQPTAGGQGRPQHPGHVGRPPDRRGDRPHRGRRIGLQPVRLNVTRHGGLQVTGSRCSRIPSCNQPESSGHQPVDDWHDIHQSLTIAPPNGTLDAGIKGLYSNRQVIRPGAMISSTGDRVREEQAAWTCVRSCASHFEAAGGDRHVPHRLSASNPARIPSRWSSAWPRPTTGRSSVRAKTRSPSWCAASGPTTRSPSPGCTTSRRCTSPAPSSSRCRSNGGPRCSSSSRSSTSRCGSGISTCGSQDGIVMYRHALVLAGGVEASGRQCEALALHRRSTPASVTIRPSSSRSGPAKPAREALDAAMFETAGEA